MEIVEIVNKKDIPDLPLYLKYINMKSKFSNFESMDISLLAKSVKQYDSK